MLSAIASPIASTERSDRRTAIEPVWLRGLLLSVALLFLAVFLLLPVAAVFSQAFGKGLQVYLTALQDPDVLSAIRLTLTVAAFTVPLNTIFGLAAAWSIAKFDFRLKHFLETLIDLPFAVSPVVSGLIFVLLFGRQGWFGSWLEAHDIKIIFALPGIVLATTFVTVPFVARELIPLMEAQGKEGEEAALTLGANAWQTFFHITVPNIKWGILYGIISCSARAVGEFGAVSVVSGHICGETQTLPLQVEALYNEYNYTAAFAVASVLASVGVVTLLLRSLIGKHRPHPHPHSALATAHFDQ